MATEETDEMGRTKAHVNLLQKAQQMHDIIGEVPTKWGGKLDAAFGQFAAAVDQFLIKAGMNPIPPKLHAVENADGTVEEDLKKADEPSVQ